MTIKSTYSFDNYNVLPICAYKYKLFIFDINVEEVKQSQ